MVLFDRPKKDVYGPLEVKERKRRALDSEHLAAAVTQHFGPVMNG